MIKWDEILVILGICVVSVALGYAIISTVQPTEAPCIEAIEREHLPSKCKEYYDTGTVEWAECMGVERK